MREIKKIIWATDVSKESGECDRESNSRIPLCGVSTETINK